MLPIALLFGCTSEPPHKFPSNVRVIAAREVPSGLEVEWSLRSSEGVTTPARDGTIIADLAERSVFDRAPAALPICSATVPVTPAEFRRDHDWTVLTTFAMQPACPPPSTSPDDYRQLTLWFRMGDEVFQGSIDPPPSMVTPTSMMDGITRRNKESDAYRARAPGEVKAKAESLRPTIAAYMGTFGAVEPLLAQGPETLASCGDVTGATAPLIDHDELVGLAGGYRPEVGPHLTSPAMLELIGLATAVGNYERTVAAAESLDGTLDLFWVRVTYERTEGQVVASSGAIPQQFVPGSYRGALYLAGRKPTRIVCAVEFRATNSDEVKGTYTLDPGSQTYVANDLDKDLDRRIADALEQARWRLVKEKLAFPRVMPP